MTPSMTKYDKRRQRNKVTGMAKKQTKTNDTFTRSIRLPRVLWGRLDAAATKSDRPIIRELIRRLEQTFEKDDDK